MIRFIVKYNRYDIIKSHIIPDLRIYDIVTTCIQQHGDIKFVKLGVPRTGWYISGFYERHAVFYGNLRVLKWLRKRGKLYLSPSLWDIPIYYYNKRIFRWIDGVLRGRLKKYESLT